MAEQYEYFIDLVATAPLNLLALAANADDLGGKGFRLIEATTVAQAEPRSAPCLLLFWERVRTDAQETGDG